MATILGLNLNPDGYDPSAALLSNGQLVAAAEEERWSGVRYEPSGIPFNAAKWCLNKAEEQELTVDLVAVGWDFNLFIDGPFERGNIALEKLISLLAKTKNGYRHKLTPVFCPHHKAHAYGAWKATGFSMDCAVIVLDGSGERESVTAWAPSRSASTQVRLEKILTCGLSQSFGFFYESVSEWLGFHKMHGGRTMGLSSYGKPRFNLPKIENVPKDLANKGSELERYRAVRKFWQDALQEATGIISLRQQNKSVISMFDDDFQFAADVAASAQKTLESDLFSLVSQVWVRAGRPSCIALSGGVALNCVASAALHAEINSYLGSGVEIVVQNPPGDAGVAVGAAVWAEIANSITAPVFLRNTTSALDTPFLGKSIDSDTLLRMSKEFGLKVVSSERACYDLLRQLLSCGKPIGVVGGRSEYGPRALGNRSLVGLSNLKGTRATINYSKNREDWRPTAPVVPLEAADSLIEGAKLSPYMLASFRATGMMLESYPEAVHVDGTVRAQIQSRCELSRGFQYVDSLAREEFGADCFLNTSFNRGTPMPNNEAQTLSTFLSMEDVSAVLVDGTTVISKD